MTAAHGHLRRAVRLSLHATNSVLMVVSLQQPETAGAGRLGLLLLRPNPPHVLAVVPSLVVAVAQTLCEMLLTTYPTIRAYMRTSLHTPSILHTACQVNSTRNHLTYGVDCKPAALQTVNKTSLQSSGMLGLTTTIPSTQQSRGRAAGYTTHDMSWKTTKYRGTTRRDIRPTAWRTSSTRAMEDPSPHPVTRNLGRPARRSVARAQQLAAPSARARATSRSSHDDTATRPAGGGGGKRGESSNTPPHGV